MKKQNRDRLRSGRPREMTADELERDYPVAAALIRREARAKARADAKAKARADAEAKAGGDDEDRRRRFGEMLEAAQVSMGVLPAVRRYGLDVVHEGYGITYRQLLKEEREMRRQPGRSRRRKTYLPNYEYKELEELDAMTIHGPVPPPPTPKPTPRPAPPPPPEPHKQAAPSSRSISDYEWMRRNMDRLLPIVERAFGVSRKEARARLGLPTNRQTKAARLAAATAATARRPAGRPKRDDIDEQAIRRAMRRKGASLRKMEQWTGIPRTTLQRYIREVLPYGADVASHHAQLLRASAVNLEVAQARGYKTLKDGLSIPMHHVTGESPWAQLRVDNPPKRRYRYRNPRKGAYALVDCNPVAREWVLDAGRRLYVTESPRKADAAVSIGLACVSFPGVRALPADSEWADVPLRDRDVVVVLDADVVNNPEVGQAEAELVTQLATLGAKVRRARLPTSEGSKLGLDEYIAGGRGERDLLDLLDPSQ